MVMLDSPVFTNSTHKNYILVNKKSNKQKNSTICILKQKDSKKKKKKKRAEKELTFQFHFSYVELSTNLLLKYELLYFNTLLSQSKQKIILQRSKCHQLKSNVNWKNKHDNNERNAVPPPVFGCQENVKERYEKAKDSLLPQ